MELYSRPWVFVAVKEKLNCVLNVSEVQSSLINDEDHYTII
jgi:hypothetical protein